jgi:altronate hydrolase
VTTAPPTPLYRRMEGDMDIDAGIVLDGATLDQVGREIFETMLHVASGESTKSERHGIGEEEFNPWILGATL